jgi:hypothetical protein
VVAQKNVEGHAGAAQSLSAASPHTLAF